LSLDDWQAWHMDYGLLTALTPPAYTASAGAAPDASWTPEAAAAAGGLVVLRSVNNGGGGTGVGGFSDAEPVLVPLPASAPSLSGCIGVQVGEAAQILSGGRLRATPHCVMRPSRFEGGGGEGEGGSEGGKRTLGRREVRGGFDRQLFVLFMQPPWSLPLRASHPPFAQKQKGQGFSSTDEHAILDDPAARALAAVVPPLASRWNPTMTFSDFSKATTGLYYGKAGVQTKRS
jgi:hypothetical protein